MNRYIVFDTETTGLDPFAGDKIIEIGAVELIDKQRSGRTFHQLINPERPLSQETISITHITDDMLINQPIFADIANDFMSFLSDNINSYQKTFLVAHNASFDIKFLNFELKNAGMQDIMDFDIIDTLDLARQKFPGQKATLDMLCERFGISLEQRKTAGHNALLDSNILVDVFLKLSENINCTSLQEQNVDFIGFKKQCNELRSRGFAPLTEEQKEHISFLAKHGIVW